MVTVFVDTSALIALLDEDDARHGDAVRTLQALRANAELVTTNYVLVETLSVCRRKLGHGAETQLVDRIFPLLRVVFVDPQTHAVALAAYMASASAASLVDHVSFTVMRNEGARVAFALDRDFELAGFQRAEAPPAKTIHDDVAPDGSELVSVSEIASRAGRPINTVQSWRRRHSDFPLPVANLAAGPIWEWPTVAAWVARRSRRSPQTSLESV